MLSAKGYLFAGEEWLKKEITSFFPFKLLFKFHYPKLALFVLCVIAAYFFFSDSMLDYYLGHLGAWSYFGVFIAGILFSFGFTSPFSAGLLLLMNPDNVILAALIGGFGSLLGDLLIFKFIKISFETEFARLKRERPFKFMKIMVKRVVPARVWHYFLFALAGFFFAAPFIPDEVAVSLLAGLSSMDVKKIAIISFCCNTLGILFILLL